ncbi:MAG: polysaccharide deacetylase family protein [Lachnospiraceae bacterium]|nr:polysaccharide deacetylase family protein [Lachnospiraceae bacterium]
MVRKDNHEPTGCDDTIDIYQYGGYHVDKNARDEDKVLYLTFDCGYENNYTSQILDVLKEQNVPACFFVTQTYIRDNIDLTKRMKEEGHQVGNHTITHPSMPERSYEEIIEEVNGCAKYMAENTGYAMDPYLRPPMGEYSQRTLKLTQDLGYKTIFWSMAYMDYDVNNQPGVDYVTAHFEKYHHNGAIILMHNVSESNADALKTVIVNMKAKGYRFASLNELK